MSDSQTVDLFRISVLSCHAAVTCDLSLDVNLDHTLAFRLFLISQQYPVFHN